MAPPPPILSLCRSCLFRHLACRPPLLSTFVTLASENPPGTGDFQRELKQQRKARHKEKRHKIQQTEDGDSKWVITCGLEVHAQLNTRRKLFSDAKTSTNASPNTHLSPIDASLPGTQPQFNPSILLPALRAALSLNCIPSPSSSFDRKHYFYWDQPAGYQITQFYSPLAKDGYLTLYPSSDGITSTRSGDDDNGGVRVKIKQVQIEQDTGKTLASPPHNLIDLNRVGSPLVEIITHPFDIPNAVFAAAVLRKIQAILRAVDACVIGMEWGGLRADVNVSIRPRGTEVLGQRCEIKNLSSLKTVQEAVESEVRRQIVIVEGGGVVLGETRGWDAEKGLTKRLRGKEGEVDYRYMPDPDLAPVVLSNELISKISSTLPPLPDAILAELMQKPYGLTMKDAKTLQLWDESIVDTKLRAVTYYREVVRELTQSLSGNSSGDNRKEIGKVVGNWLINELGGHLQTWSANPLPPSTLTSLLHHLLTKKITGPTAKHLLTTLLSGDPRSIETIISEENLGVTPVSDSELQAIVEKVALGDAKNVVDQICALGANSEQEGDDGGRGSKKRKGLVNWCVGKCLKETGGRVEAARVESAVERVIGRK